MPPVGTRAVPVLITSGDLWRRVALRRALSQDGYSLIQVIDGTENLEQHCLLLPDSVVILGPDILERLDPKALARIAEAARTLVWASGLDNSRIQHLIRARCKGYIDRDAPPSVLRKCVRAIAAGDLWFSRPALATAIGGLLSCLEAQSLTAREKQVLDLVGRGYKNRAIARALGITYDTVRWHLRSVHGKLGRTRRQLYAVCGAREADSPPAPVAGGRQAS